MTNSFLVVVFVLWSTNTMDILLTPSGDEIQRSTIVTQTHIYQIPGQTSVTNVVPVLTNSVHLKMQWVPVTNDLPAIPRSATSPRFNSPNPPIMATNYFTITPNSLPPVPK